MNYLLQAIPNDIYNSVVACKNAKEMWQRIKRLMFGSEVTSHVRHSRLMDEFDKFVAKEGESLESVYKRLITLVNIMDLQFEPHVLASKANKAAKNHDPLALIAHLNSSSSQSHANPSYSPQPYYVTHPSLVVDYDDKYQRELQGDSQEDKLTTAMMNQAMVLDGRVDIQTKNAGYGGNANKNTGRQNKNQVFNAGNGSDESNQIIQRVPRTDSTPGKANVQCYNCNKKGHYARECQKPKVCDAKYFREQMLLAMKDEARSNLTNKENDFMLDSSYGEDTLEELTAAVILMARLQPADDNADHVRSYDAKAVSEVNASFMVHEQNPERLKKAIAAQPKLYNGDSLHIANLINDSPDSEETLEDAEESRLKMRNKMVQISYSNLNALYETFVPQQEFSAEQTYFLIPSTSNNGSESKEGTSELPILKMPKESRLLKMIDTMGVEINGVQTRIDKTLLEDKER
ncbi:RNA-directed DNA polymerase, eukaryota, reverse transcriptase zinc-binding domain protein [Tanacetum coccineum]